MFIGVFVAIWWKGKEAQERALKAAREYCEKRNVQFLDECVFESNWKLMRNSKGRLCLKRIYQFEFTASGNDRFFGEVVASGLKVESVSLGNYIDRI